MSEKFETTPLALDGVLYITVPPGDVYALDAETGARLWRYSRNLPPKLIACCGLVNRGLGMLGDRLFMATLDAYTIALDRKTGRLLWESKMIDYSQGYSGTLAPLVVKDKVMTGTAGGEYGIRGFIDAYDVETGERLWRFYTIPGPGEFGHDTWAGDSWRRGGASIWITPSYDPELNLVYWGVGNPGPDWNGDVRLGDNLFSDSVVALDADSGERKWHFQFTPHDVHDWDATQVMVLFDSEYKGEERKAAGHLQPQRIQLSARPRKRRVPARRRVRQAGTGRSASTKRGVRSAGRASCPPPRATKFIPAWPAARIGCRLRSARRPI